MNNFYLFKIFFTKKIFPLLNNITNNNIAILEKYNLIFFPETSFSARQIILWAELM